MTTVRRAERGDVEELADILADAFSTDAAMSWVFGEPTSARIFEIMIRSTYLPHGDCYLCDGAAALWLASDIHFNEPFSNSLRLLPAMLANGGPKTIWRGLGADSRLGRVHPREPHQYLFAVGVRHGMQGRGLGKQILAPMLEHCDETGQDAYLENSKPQNNNFYRGLGFEFRGEPVALGKGAPSVAPMWRPAQLPEARS